MQMGRIGILYPQDTGLVAIFSSYDHFRQLDHYLAGKTAIEIKHEMPAQ
jgi:hypothetical protein